MLEKANTRSLCWAKNKHYTMEVNKNRILRNTIFLYAKTIISTIVVFCSTRIVLNALGAQDYGVYGIVGGVIAMLGYLNISMSSATQRYMNIAKGAEDTERSVYIFNNATIIHLAMGIMVVMALEILYYWMFNGILNIPANRIDAAKIIYHLMAVSTFFTMITVPYDAMINAHEDFLYYSIVGIVESLLKLGAAFAIVYYANDKLILYGVLVASISITMMLVMRIYCHTHYEECKLSLRKYGQKNLVKELSAFAGWNFVGAFSSIFGNFGSTILMNHFFGTIVIAAKNIGDQIGGELSILTANLTKALNPVIMKSEGGGDRKQMVQLSLTTCRLGFLLYSFLAIPFIFETEFILGLWLKKIPDWAVLFCQLQVLRLLLEQLFSPMRTMLIAAGTIKHLNIADLILGIITFLSLGLLYKIGLPSYYHYIISIFILVLIESAIKIYLCHYYCDLKYRDFINNAFAKSILSASSCSVACFILHHVISGYNMFIVVALMVLISILCIVVLGLNKKERTYLIKAIKR